jgi:cytochrome oxidase assembly protein ShyY1
VVGAVVTILFVRLAIWQLDRLDERRTQNALVEQRRDASPQELGALVTSLGRDPAALNHRPVIARGVYRDDLEFFSVGRTYGDASGTLVATPLELADGTLIVVVRGLVPSGTAGPPADGFAPPDGLVEVTGWLDDGEEPLRIGEPDPVDGVIRSISRIDLAYIDRWMDEEVADVSVVLDSEEPAPTEAVPIRIPLEELTEGSHLGYAIQWFGFAIIVMVGVGYLVWRAGTSRAPSSPVEEPTHHVDA